MGKVTVTTTHEINSDPIDRYAPFHVTNPIKMVCGAVVKVEGINQKCPNSGNCTEGHKECWVIKVT